MNGPVIDWVVEFDEFNARCAVLACLNSTRVEDQCPNTRVKFAACIDAQDYDYAEYVASVDRVQFRDSPFDAPEQTFVVTIPAFPVPEKVNIPVIPVPENVNFRVIAVPEKFNKSLLIPRKRLLPAEVREEAPVAESVPYGLNPSVPTSDDPAWGVPNVPGGTFSRMKYFLDRMDLLK